LALTILQLKEGEETPITGLVELVSDKFIAGDGGQGDAHELNLWLQDQVAERLVGNVADSGFELSEDVRIVSPLTTVHQVELHCPKCVANGHDPLRRIDYQIDLDLEMRGGLLRMIKEFFEPV
jgi:hypothetical protein